MLRHALIILFLLLFVGCTPPRSNVFKQQGTSEKIIVDISYDIRRKSGTYNFIQTTANSLFVPKAKVLLCVPKNIRGRQTIEDMTWTPEPTRIFDQGENRYAEFVLKMPKNGIKLNLHIEAELFQHDLSTTVIKGYAGFILSSDLAPYLKNEPMHQKDNLFIQRIAANIPGNTDLDIVRNIYSFVVQNLTYDSTKYERSGAVSTAITRRGVCIDYCDLFVALCRAKGIPARVVFGLSTIFDVTPKHTWAEVYLENYGWVPFDPTQSPEVLQKWTFSYMPPTYFYLSYGSTGLPEEQIGVFDNLPGGLIKNQYEVVEYIEFYKPFHRKINSVDVIKELESGGSTGNN